MNVFITGGTGYIGSRLIPVLIQRGHAVKALVRAGSEKKLPVHIQGVLGDALRLESYAEAVSPADAFIHLVGVAHPSPAKAKQFRDIDLVSIKVAVRAAAAADVRHFIYLSVAQPAPVMKAFQEVRRQGEELVRASGMNATFVRPWYVLGPGHWWPLPLLPFYRLAEHLPPTREAARRLGLVRVDEIVRTLAWAVENVAAGLRVLDVPKIRALALNNRGRLGSIAPT